MTDPLDRPTDAPAADRAGGRGYLTVAFGGPEYLRLAESLRLSLARVDPGVPVAVVTDADPASLPGFDHVVPLLPEGGRTLYHKLALDRYSPFDRTIFIDSDCLAVRSLDGAWSLFRDAEIAVVGTEATSGSWFGAEIADLRAVLGLPGPLPKFNSGLVYWRRGARARAVFAEARRLWDDYESLGLGRFRAGMFRADEPLLSVAMARHGVAPLPDDGTVMNTPFGLRGRMTLDLRAGVARFVRAGGPVAPAVVHFCGYRRGGYYRREAMFLRLAADRGWDDRWAWLVSRAVWLPLVAVDTGAAWDAARTARDTVGRWRARRRRTPAAPAAAAAAAAPAPTAVAPAALPAPAPAQAAGRSR